MKRKLLSFLILAFYTQAYSQNSEEFIPSDAHSPNAAELSSYGLAISLSALPLRAQRIVNNISALAKRANTYAFSNGYLAKAVDSRIDFVPSVSHLDDNDLFLYAVRIPLLVGIQTPKRWLSLQTGLGLYAGGSKYKYRYKGEDKSDKHHLHTSHVGVQWLLTAGIGPVTVNYTQNLTPLFKLADGTNAYPSSFTVGIDIWYLMCRLSRNKD